MNTTPAFPNEKAPRFWPALIDALIAKLRAGVAVKLLLSHWQHTSPEMWDYLRALQSTAAACNDAYGGVQNCKGTLEIKAFEIPGWDQTSGTDPKFAPFSRVNHAKFIVTDQRFNIGTSNMVWGYMYTAAGTSFNSDNVGLRMALQGVFDRDWNSAYATSDLPSTPPSSYVTSRGSKVVV